MEFLKFLQKCDTGIKEKTVQKVNNKIQFYLMDIL